MTITELLDQVQYRLGMNKDSTGWFTQRPVILSFAATAAALLDEDFRDRLRYVPNVLLEGAQMGSYDEPETITTYTAPPDADPMRIESLSVQWSGLWRTLPKGITQNMRNYAYASTPTYIAWDVLDTGEIEVWPHPTVFHPIRVSYHRKAQPYTTEDGCVDMDNQLMLLLVLDQAIPFYGRPDAESNNRKLNSYLGNIRAKQLVGLKYNKADNIPGRQGTPDQADMVYRVPYSPSTSA